LVFAQSVAGHRVSLLQSRLAMNHINACEDRLFLLLYPKYRLVIRVPLQ
jgi:hypothetical protein